MSNKVNKNDNMRIVTTNRKAWHEFIVEDTYEAGIALKGSEVKSLRTHGCSIQESYARQHGGEVFIMGMYIPPYEKASIDKEDPIRTRKLLLHHDEIERIITKTTQRGYTLIPLKVYFRHGWAKVEIGVARKRKKGDKRRKKLERQQKKEIDRELSRYN